MELLIKNAKIVDWSQNFIGDVYINEGIICEMGKNLKKDCKIIDAEGLTLLPSFIDLHVHFREPGFTNKEDIESGSYAAAKGGYTMVNLMANTKPVCSSMDTINYVLNRAKEVGIIDVHQVSSITNNFDGKDISHLDRLDPSVKIISEDGNDVMDSKVMLEAMVKAKESGRIVMCHCEEHLLSNIDTRLSENTMTWRNIALAEFTGCAVHIAHVSTKESMEYIIEAKKKGINVTCEVAPHHIALVDNDYRVNPPIREKEDVEFLIKSIKDGWVDAIGTDHAPHTAEDKKNGSPGISGIETAFSVCYTKLVKEEKISFSKLSEIMSRNPAYIMGVKKGQIKIGYDADLVLVDTERKYEICSDTFKSKGKNTPFNGTKVYGAVVRTLKSGNTVFSEM
ncbi:dihydroorotase [Clostridium carboxidivorans P7]|uniref:Dihydroorotase n=1 Tax=Clostridium carboxidivorans P7 TaxID=536227 RepID=C6Q1L7_9CLOT|nr:dihydroorotase [Clostridium carboxidivorans]AKN32695.1 dihydroorotase [Clostridium carboxidivorans P7]EET84610.1 dihydroorotase, multifunctional complex type [Clostridium carboxidivorans P7]EFG90070.1 putative dihydroorotase [Clostridium carboxidivorans P7]